MASNELNAVVAQRIEVAPGLIVLRVVPEGWSLPEFRPGQFAVLGLPGSAPKIQLSDPDPEPPPADRLIRRAYSIASSYKATAYLEFFITLVRSGGLTPRLSALEPGDHVWLGPKITGTFTLDAAPTDRDVVMVATGTGLAPYMSMMRTVLHDQPHRRFAVILGARHSWDLGYHAELVTMEKLSAGFTYLPVISRPGQEPVPWHGRTGYVTNVWDSGELAEIWGDEPTPDSTSVFLCGNPAMIDDMVAHLGERGFREHNRKTPGEIFVERYW